MWDQVGQTLHESTVRVLSRIAGLLPGALALVLAVLVSAVIAWLAAIVLRRLLARIDFDERLDQWGLKSVAEWSPRESPSLLVTRAVSWSIILVGFTLGLAAFDAALSSRLAFSLFTYLPNVLTAILLVIVGGIVARYLARNILIEGVNMHLQYARFLSIGVKWMVMVLAVAMALEHLRIGSSIVRLAFGILFGGIVLALALAVGLGSKELVSRSLERESDRTATANAEEPFRHI
ncbi:MAG TPA: hypothetical protein VKB79_30940 [Bryobacteraceae bacterium]|nr:hypothetical protein [Bryobacteraceae bacterium]